ncbi:hypothetical protein MUN88_14395 [Gracilibacillus caseinilyticus]|uniref:Phage integrase family protein n=1 Tax=Gracilibacillus caseinilyticus TaxID=2932256 RepID=A0ABY4ESM8_9BACI|nr:hypothetical protein [Gracilibacillus caseinilyticus]UOQ47254.1 hypothetical protein MUN88_14395 [Gracilibacillus caseinilyticus]
MQRLKRLPWISNPEEWELIDKNPCAKIKTPTVKHKKSEVYSVEESKQLFSLLQEENLVWQLIIQLAAVLGARQDELAALEGKQLNFENNVSKR